HDQGHVALLEVAHTAVDELGAAARRRLGEVVLLQEEGAVAAGGGLERGAQSCGAATNDDHVPELGPLPQPFQTGVPVHTLHHRYGWTPTHQLVGNAAGLNLTKALPLDGGGFG